jgi:putative DNA primase/helicase
MSGLNGHAGAKKGVRLRGGSPARQSTGGASTVHPSPPGGPCDDAAVAALAARGAGVSVCPPVQSRDQRRRSKRPRADFPRPDGEGYTWDPLKEQHASDALFERWYGELGCTGVGWVCGSVSGGLAVVDFDTGEHYELFSDRAREWGMDGLVERVEAGCLGRTPSGGHHLPFYFCEVVPSTKLAMRPAPTAENPHAQKTLIELKGEGGFIIEAPTRGDVHPTGEPYVRAKGSVETIATVDKGEYEALMALARSFDERPAKVVGDTSPPPAGSRRGEGEGEGLRPGDDYAQRTGWGEVLSGWARVCTKGDTTYWRRPGKSFGVSASTNYMGKGLLRVFSTSTAFGIEESYTKFAAYATLHHQGDFRAAAKALGEQGYGERADRNGKAHEKNGVRLGEGAPTRRAPGGGVAVPLPPVGGAVEAEGEAIRPNESADDPARLARLMIDGSFRHEDGLTLRFWQGEYLEWDGAWRPVLSEDLRARTHRVIKGEFDRINLEAIALWQSDMANKPADAKPRPRPQARKVTGALVSNTTLAISGYARLEPRTPQPSWLDGDAPFPAEDVLPARNALVYLPALVGGDDEAIRPPTPRFFAPYCLDYDFDPGAAEPTRWLNFLGSLWPDDPESISVLQEWFGLLLTPDTSHQKILMMIGPKRSGRGTIVRVARRLIGEDNAPTPTLGALGTNFGLAPLIGKPAAFITDARLSGRSDLAQITERLLAISGEDAQTIDRKHQPAITVKLPTRFTLVSNELPKLRDASGALAGRMILLRLTETFYGREDHALTAALVAELPGILLWAIEGWRRLRERGYFVQPEFGKSMVAEFEDLGSPVRSFIRDRCTVGAGLTVPTSALYEAWKDWCLTQGKEKPGDEATFGRDLRAAEPRLDRKQRRIPDAGRHWVYEGIELGGDASDFD